MRSSLNVADVKLEAPLQQFIERRLQFSLSRFSPRIRSVSVTLGNQNGPLGEAGFSCRILVRLSNKTQPVEAEVQGNDLQSIFTYALERASRTVERHLIRNGRERET